MIFLTIFAYFFSFLSLGLNLTLFIRLKAPASFYFVIFQLVAAALSPVLIVSGIAGAELGWISRAMPAVAAGSIGACISLIYIISVMAIKPGFREAFGAGWKTGISPTRKRNLIPRHWQLLLPETPDPTFEKDVPFWTIPGTTRDLFCDIWQPAVGVERSGLAVIYLHGSAWYFLDKDYGTRPLFRQLTAQGHVVMDVAYRLTPEVDIYGMVGDVKRAIIWMKENAHRYKVNPDRVILGGGSAGGHLALLAAYTPDNMALTPQEINGKSPSVHAVFSLYGPTDLFACYEHLNQSRLKSMHRVAIGQPGAATMEKNMTDAGRLDILLGGHIHEVPEMYELASPVTHVRAEAPPTLLIQGEPDVIAPSTSTRQLHEKLVSFGVPSVNIIYPLTNHAFDLLFPVINPAAHAAFSSIEWFLELVSDYLPGKREIS